MRLTVTTPLATLLDRQDVMHVRAEDETGSFGILPGHAAFITALSVSVLSWRDRSGGVHYVALAGGVLSMMAGEHVQVASSQAVVSDDLEQLETETLSRFRHDLETERVAHSDSERLRLAAIRQMIRLLRPGRAGRAGSGRD